MVLDSILATAASMAAGDVFCADAAVARRQAMGISFVLTCVVFSAVLNIMIKVVTGWSSLCSVLEPLRHKGTKEHEDIRLNVIESHCQLYELWLIGFHAESQRRNAK